MEKILGIDIPHQMQATYGDKCVDVSTVDAGYGSLGEKLGKPLVLGERKILSFLGTEFRNLFKIWQKFIEAGEDYIGKVIMRICK